MRYGRADEQRLEIDIKYNFAIRAAEAVFVVAYTVLLTACGVLRESKNPPRRCRDADDEGTLPPCLQPAVFTRRCHAGMES
jgi:hypothetical protein